MTTSDFKAPNSYDAEERDRFMENVLEGNSLAEQQACISICIWQRVLTIVQVKIPTGWDEADSNNEVRKIANGVETINLLKVDCNRDRVSTRCLHRIAGEWRWLGGRR